MMRWTIGLLLVAATGCGYRDTKMVACPGTDCHTNQAQASPEGLAGPTQMPADTRVAPPEEPATTETPLPPEAPAPTP